MSFLKIKPVLTNSGYDMNVVAKKITERAKQFASRAKARILTKKIKRSIIVPITSSSDFNSIFPESKSNKKSSNSNIVYPKNGGKTLRKRGGGGGGTCKSRQ